MNPTRPRRTRFWICFEAHRQDLQVWSIKWGRYGWMTGERLSISGRGRLQTVYRGPHARQPRAYLRGDGLSLTVKHLGGIGPNARHAIVIRH